MIGICIVEFIIDICGMIGICIVEFMIGIDINICGMKGICMVELMGICIVEFMNGLCGIDICGMIGICMVEFMTVGMAIGMALATRVGVGLLMFNSFQPSPSPLVPVIMGWLAYDAYNVVGAKGNGYDGCRYDMEG